MLELLSALFGGKAAQDYAYAEWRAERAHAAMVADKWERELERCKDNWQRGNLMHDTECKWLLQMAQTAINLHAEKYQLTTRTRSSNL